MPVTSDVTATGTLTGSPTVDTVRTGAGTEYIFASFLNYDSVARTLSLYVNGSADANLVLDAATLEPGERVTFEHKIGNGDTLRAMASAGSAINYIVSIDSLTA